MTDDYLTHTNTILRREQLDQFERDGYIVLSGLLSDDLVDRLVQAGEFIVQQTAKDKYYSFSCIERGMIFSVPAECRKQQEDKDNTATATDEELVQVFRQAALRSKIAQVATELMQLDPEQQNCRILRDVFLAKPIHAKETCDWHVDDQGFWPAQFRSTASEQSGKDQHGINVWLALDDMPADCAGSMAVAPGSHNAPWRERAYDAIGQDRSRDVDASMEEVVQLFANPIKERKSTCALGVADPELKEQIEASAAVMDLKRGDAIFCTRLLFHRTLDVTEKGMEYYQKPTLNRYSIRYVPGSVRLPGVYNSFEWAALMDSANAGRTLDEVVSTGTCWYPQVWPTLESAIDEKLDNIAKSALVDAKQRAEVERKALGEAVRLFLEQQAPSKDQHVPPEEQLAPSMS